MNLKNTFKLILSIAVAQLAGIIGSFFTISSIGTWYEGIVKPSFNPPSWIFGPVWLLLYTFMGIAMYLVWQKGLNNKKIRFAFIFFLVHLVVNALWSIAFFGLQNISFAFLIIIVLWFMILASIYMFSSIDKRASYILIPYLLWVTFATILNYSIWQLNI